MFVVAAASSGRAYTSLSAQEEALEESWGQELELSTKSPVKRVVELLQKMKTQLEVEATNEAETYHKMVCWCKTNDQDKQKAISDADASSSDLESQIGAYAARHGKLSTEIESTKQQIEQEEKSLAMATSIREKEASQFTEEETNTIQIVTNLKNAIDILSKHHGGSLLQMDSAIFASIAAVIRDATSQYEIIFGNEPVVASRASQPVVAFLAASKSTLVSDIKKEMGSAMTRTSLPVDIAARSLAKVVQEFTGEAFVQATNRQAPSGYASYSARSDKIFGLLKQMKDEFEATLSQMQKDELRNRESFSSLAASKNEQIDFAKAKLDEMEGEHAQNQKALSDANENLALTREQRSADVEFLRNLKLSCQSLDEQWKDRSTTRSEEIRAVAEAIAILTEDDARDLLHHTVSLLQVRSVASSAEVVEKLRRKVATSLRKAAQSPLVGVDSADLLEAWKDRKTSTSNLSTLATSVELDNFVEVKRIMDKMVDDLKTQQKEEVEFKAHCQKELDGNEKMIYEKEQVKNDLETTLDNLASAIKNLELEIVAANTQIAETKVQIKRASEAREQENVGFQRVVADQRATQNILQKAVARLDAFYRTDKVSQGSQPTFLQRIASTSLSAQTPPEQFNAYQNNSGSSSVISLLHQIIEDSKNLEKESIAGENVAQASYEDFVKGANKVISDMEASVMFKTKSIADAKTDSALKSSDHKSVVEELESLSEYKGDLHMECDFILKNFDIRQRARTAEIEAIQDAKAYLSGQMN